LIDGEFGYLQFWVRLFNGKVRHVVIIYFFNLSIFPYTMRLLRRWD
jgi:hypothetical protein